MMTSALDGRKCVIPFDWEITEEAQLLWLAPNVQGGNGSAFFYPLRFSVQWADPLASPFQNIKFEITRNLASKFTDLVRGVLPTVVGPSPNVDSLCIADGIFANQTVAPAGSVIWQGGMFNAQGIDALIPGIAWHQVHVGVPKSSSDVSWDILTVEIKTTPITPILVTGFLEFVEFGY